MGADDSRKLTEKEKLLLGESFNPEGKELINQRTIAHGMCAEYNAASELDETSKTEAGFSILMMNAWKRVYKELLRTFMHLLFYNDGICSIMAIQPVFQ